MRNNTLPVTLVVLLLFLHITSFEQCPGVPLPSSTLDDKQAAQRLTYFEKYTKPVYKKLKVAAREIVVETSSFRSVLDDLNKKRYDGLRFYLAIAPKTAVDSARLSIVLVPTNDFGINDQYGQSVSDDDERNAYIIDEAGKLVNINLLDPANRHLEKQLEKYVNAVIPKLQAEYQQRTSRSLAETKSLWYSDEVLFKGDRSLLEYLKTCNAITQIKIKFAAWVASTGPEAEFKHKTEILFELPNEKIFSLSSDAIKRNFLLKNKDVVEIFPKDLEKDAYTNTGNPCPQRKCP